jgi:hypothetical protein
MREGFGAIHHWANCAESMSYDLFISYSRRDDAQGRVMQLVERIKADFLSFAGRPLSVFFDKNDIQGMDDWRQKIQQSLRESHLFLAVLSPNYLARVHRRHRARASTSSNCN